MKTTITLRHLALAALTATTIGVGPVGHIVDAGRTGPEVAERIDVEEGNKVFLVGHAIGVQIYGCKTGATGLGWELIAPRADLYGDNGKLIATHYGGPTWRAAWSRRAGAGPRRCGPGEAGRVPAPGRSAR